MKKTFILLATLLAAANVSVSTAQNPNTPSKANSPALSAPEGTIAVSGLKPFAAVEAEGRMEVFVTIDQASPAGMTIELNGNDPNRLKWWDDEGGLKIKHSYTKTSRPVVVRLNCHTLTDLTLSGVSMTVQTPWVASMATIDLASGAKLVATLEVFDLRITARTKSTALISGSGTYADCFCYSGSALDLRDYAPRSVSLTAVGHSECFVRCEERLVVEAVDGAAVFYRGKPGILRLHEARGGHANPIGN